MKIAFMFSGQGAQYVGMCKELYDEFEVVREVFKQANQILGYSQEDILFKNEAKLNDTLYTQTAMFVMYQSILRVLSEKKISAEYSMGLSLGEYGAYLHNNVFDFETGLKIIQKRAIFMNEAANLKPGKMSAILGMNATDLKILINQVDGYVKIANYNTYGQLVVSGEEKAILKLNELALNNGARKTILLNTSGAFHSDLMKNASIRLSEYLKNIELNEPQKKILLNITGDFYHKNIKKAMIDQITHSVLYYQMVEKLISLGVDTFIEIGPKRTLCSFVKKINRNLNVLNIEDIKSLNNTLRKIGG